MNTRIPLKMGGVVIGTATIRDDGTFIAVVNNAHNNSMAEVFELVNRGFVFGLTLAPILNPAVDGNLNSRVEYERSLADFGGFHLAHSRTYRRYLKIVPLKLDTPSIPD